jgi:hypothetical protein
VLAVSQRKSKQSKLLSSAVIVAVEAHRRQVSQVDGCVVWCSRNGVKTESRGNAQDIGLVLKISLKAQVAASLVVDLSSMRRVSN